jgi:hypothetical protein
LSNKSIKNFNNTIDVNSSTIRPFPFKDKDATHATIVGGGSYVFGDKLAKEVFNAKRSIGSPKVKGRGALHDIRLLKLGSMTTKNI